MQLIMIVKTEDRDHHCPRLLLDPPLLGSTSSSTSASTESSASGGVPISALRLLRLLSVLRICRSVKLLQYSKPLWLVCHGLFAAIGCISWIMALLGFLIYVTALLLVKLVGQDAGCRAASPVDLQGGNLVVEHFGDVWAAVGGVRGSCGL